MVRPVMMLRLLFEEDEVGRRASAARQDPSGTKWRAALGPDRGRTPGVRPGTQPLTAGEVVENWDEVGPRRFAQAEQDAEFQLADIDETLRCIGGAPRGRGGRRRRAGLAARRAARCAAQRAGRVVAARSGIVRHDLLGLSTVDGSGDVLAGWRGPDGAAARRRRFLQRRAGRRGRAPRRPRGADAVLWRVAAADAAAGGGAAGRRREPRDGPAHLRVGRPLARRRGADADAAPARHHLAGGRAPRLPGGARRVRAAAGFGRLVGARAH